MPDVVNGIRSERLLFSRYAAFFGVIVFGLVLGGVMDRH